MKIGIDARSLEKSKTGVGRYLSNLLKFWKDDKNNEFYLYFKDKIPQDDFLKNDNFKLRFLKNPFGFSSNFFLQHFLLPYNLKKDKADFFFSPFYLKPFYCPVKSSIVLHDISYEAHPEWFDFKSQFILRALSKYSARTADKIFTVSNYSKEEIIKYYKINPEKITVTYLAADSGFVKIDNEVKTMAIMKKYNLNDKFILSVGSIFNRRRISEIIEAFEKLVMKHNDYQLLIIGKNHTHPFVDMDKKIKSANGKLGRNGIIKLDYASDEELTAFYSSCFLNIYLSDYEGFGLPIVEAQFFGKPVITSYNSSLIEAGGESVEFVKNNTVEEIYESLEKVISDENYRLDLVLRGDENIKRFNWERCARGTIGRILNVECRI
jgi:glycosyltransferase involved in cell wall biosynthesis